MFLFRVQYPLALYEKLRSCGQIEPGQPVREVSNDPIQFNLKVLAKCLAFAQISRNNLMSACLLLFATLLQLLTCSDSR